MSIPGPCRRPAFAKKRARANGSFPLQGGRLGWGLNVCGPPFHPLPNPSCRPHPGLQAGTALRARRTRLETPASPPGRGREQSRWAKTVLFLVSRLEACRATALALVWGLCSGLAAAQGVAFVSSEKDHALSIIDLATLSVTGTIPTCKRPRHLQLSADKKQLMVACGESNVADIIDLATRKSVRHLPLGDDPEAFDLSPDGKTLYVSSEDEGALTFIDVASGKVIRKTEVGKEPEGVKVSPDGKIVWVTSEVASLVHVISTLDGKVLKNVKVGKRPRRFALTPDGSQLWVSNELGASVTILSTADYSTLATLKFELKGARDSDITPVGITMTRDGKRAFVALGRANHVAFVDVLSRKVTDLVLVGKRAWNVSLDKAEKRLLVVNGLSDDVTVVDVASAKAIKTIAVGRVPYAALVVD